MQADITITRRSGLQVVPESFFFEVAVSGFDATGPGAGEIYDNRFHELYYFWDFGDPYSFTAPQNLPAVHKNANAAYGPMASHTYRTAGTYNAACLVVEPSSGKSATANLSITIGDANAQFPTIRTIFVDPTGSGTGAPAGAIVLTTFDAAVSNVQGSDGIPRRIMLKRGQSFSFAGASIGDAAGRRWPSCHIVAEPGAGAKPVVTCTGGFFWNDTATTGSGTDKDFVIQNIVFEGPFDSTANTGGKIDAFAVFSNAPNLLLFDGCSFDGFSHAVYNDAGSSTNVQHRVTVFNDTTVTNFTFWGFADSDKTASIVTGCSFRAPVDALVDSTSNQGAPIRFGGKDRASIVHSSEFFSRQGWSSLGNYIAVQPCVRFNSEGFEGSKVVCQANSMEGGFNVLSLDRAGGSTGSAVNAVIEKNYLLGTYQTYDMISSDAGGVTVRNNIMVMPDSGRLATTNDPTNFFVAEDRDNDATNRATPINVYNNTLVNLANAANYVGGSAPAMTEAANYGSFTTFNNANNVVHQPSIDTPDTGDAPLQNSTILWPAREKGYRTTTIALQTQTATAPGAVATYAPLGGSSALGDALNEPVAYDDFYGEQRPQFPARGAFEMP